jgi:DNA-binding transcriptional ArsR family regulator
MGRKADTSQKAKIRADWNSDFRRSRQQNLFALLDIIRSCRFEEGGGRHCGMIAIGELEGLPYAVSSLADALGEPRSTTSRKLHMLTAQGLVRLETRHGKKLAVLTEAGWARLQRWWSVLDGPVDFFVATEAAHRRDRD